MTEYSSMLRGSLRPILGTALSGLGFSESAPLKWRRTGLEVRTVQDSKATDPFRGGAFTLEIEHSADGRFEVKLAGRTRLGQLLDSRQQMEFLEMRNRVAARLPRPSEAHLAMIHGSVRDEYLKAFHAADQLEKRFWMRFSTEQDVEAWGGLLVGVLPDVVARAETVEPNALVLGQSLHW